MTRNPEPYTLPNVIQYVPCSVNYEENYPAGAAGVGIKGGVGGGSVSSTSSPIGAHMAGPITLKLSGIDRGNSESVLVKVRGGMIQDL